MDGRSTILSFLRSHTIGLLIIPFSAAVSGCSQDGPDPVTYPSAGGPSTTAGNGGALPGGSGSSNGGASGSGGPSGGGGTSGSAGDFMMPLGGAPPIVTVECQGTFPTDDVSKAAAKVTAGTSSWGPPASFLDDVRSRAARAVPEPEPATRRPSKRRTRSTTTGSSGPMRSSSKPWMPSKTSSSGASARTACSTTISGSTVSKAVTPSTTSRALTSSSTLGQERHRADHRAGVHASGSCQGSLADRVRLEDDRLAAQRLRPLARTGAEVRPAQRRQVHRSGREQMVLRGLERTRVLQRKVLEGLTR